MAEDDRQPRPPSQELEALRRENQRLRQMLSQAAFGFPASAGVSPADPALDALWSALEDSPLWVVLSTLEEGRYLRVNQAFLEATGFRAEEVIGRTSLELGVWDDLAVRDEVLRRLRREDKVLGLEVSRRAKDGRILHTLYSGHLIPHQGGQCLLSLSLDTSRQRESEEKLRQSEQRFRRLFDDAPLAYQSLDADGCFIEVNQAWLKALGHRREEVIGRWFGGFLHPDSLPVFETKFPCFKEAGQVSGVEFRMLRADGQYLEVSFEGAIAYNQDGSFRQTHCIFQDLTQRRRAEAETQASQARMRAIFDHSLDAIVLCDDNANFVEVNPAAGRLCGYDPSAMAGRSLLDLAPDGDRDQALVLWRRFLAEGSLSGEYALRRQDGTLVEVEYRAVANIAPGLHLGVLHDISDRRRALEALKASQERLAQVIEFLPDPTFVIDTQGRVLHWNRQIELLTGVPAAEMVGRGDHAYATPFYGRRRPVLIDLVLRPDPEAAALYRHFHQEGDRLFSETFLEDFRGLGHTFFWNTASPLRDGRGRVIGAIESIRDVTAQRLMERDRARMETQLRQAQKMEALGTLASGVAHDFNNILAAILGYAELAQDNAGQGRDNRAELEQVIAAAGRAAELVRHILTFSRQMEPELKPLDLNREVLRALEVLGRTLPKMIEIQTDLGRDLPPVLANAGQIEQVLLNLAVNAADAMPQGGRLSISTERVDLDQDYCSQHLAARPGPHLRLTVGDTGHGMSAEVLEHIFDPFFTTKGPGKGTGLGLATVYGIVTGHHGSIHCYSQPGQGAVFVIHLPLARDHGPAPSPDRSAQAEPPGGSESILLVDDEPTLRQVGQRMLAAAGYRVRAAASGEQVLEILDSGERPDLIILDLGMPGMGGLACLDQILSRDPEQFVLIASGYAGSDQVRQSLENGAAGFVPKPFRRAELLGMVRRLLDGRELPQPDPPA
ncbi:MAG: PAS domain S-box protein [Desulfarculus sp.]|nr:PAS domain S-box protein [Desulfarculus sp.]